jgi:hypothetical protein
MYHILIPHFIVTLSPCAMFGEALQVGGREGVARLLTQRSKESKRPKVATFVAQYLVFFWGYTV